ncbi:MAG: 2'-5' RNA ligase family protein [Nanoarchaeota archaeon]|nr:2'-5' RNA ligase family protein [Nanoarchaeota archaeon]
MNYRIVYLLKGESKKYAEKLIKDVAKKFHVNYCYSGRQSAHITLKYRFETNNLKKVEKLIEGVCKNNKSSYFEIGGIGNFTKHALILKVKPSKEMVKFEKELVKTLKDYKGDLSKYDKLLHKNFHVGIAHHDIKEKFSEINSYLKKFNRKFKVKFDKVYLIKKPKNRWIIRKRYIIK